MVTTAIVERLRGADPLLKILATSTLFSTLGRGVLAGAGIAVLALQAAHRQESAARSETAEAA